jgi:hypothetical protein
MLEEEGTVRTNIEPATEIVNINVRKMLISNELDSIRSMVDQRIL